MRHVSCCLLGCALAGPAAAAALPGLAYQLTHSVNMDPAPKVP
jgi:hypothetical protein